MITICDLIHSTIPIKIECIRFRTNPSLFLSFVEEKSCQEPSKNVNLQISFNCYFASVSRLSSLVLCYLQLCATWIQYFISVFQLSRIVCCKQKFPPQNQKSPLFSQDVFHVCSVRCVCSFFGIVEAVEEYFEATCGRLRYSCYHVPFAQFTISNKSISYKIG